jgi:hypothetical protein
MEWTLMSYISERDSGLVRQPALGPFLLTTSAFTTPSVSYYTLPKDVTQVAGGDSGTQALKGVLDASGDTGLLCDI